MSTIRSMLLRASRIYPVCAAILVATKSDIKAALRQAEIVRQ